MRLMLEIHRGEKTGPISRGLSQNYSVTAVCEVIATVEVYGRGGT